MDCVPLHLRLLQVTVPAGQQILTFMYGYQRDPAYWPVALEFKPERWLPVRLAHSCKQSTWWLQLHVVVAVTCVN
jgi:cytochrome P450